MRAELRNAREAAVALQDAALSRHSPNFDAAFAAAMDEVVDRLGRVVADAEGDPSTEPVELSRTCRWLGDAWFEHGRFARRPSWERGAEAYLKAERLLADRIAPVEQAKLDFNFANTLCALSEGTDVGLLEAAEVRYERAAKVFRDNHLPNFEAMIASRLGTMRPQLKLAREHALMQGNVTRAEILLERFSGADKIEQARIAGEIRRTVDALDRGGLASAVGEAVAAVTQEARSVRGMKPQLARTPDSAARRLHAYPPCRRRRPTHARAEDGPHARDHRSAGRHDGVSEPARSAAGVAGGACRRRARPLTPAAGAGGGRTDAPDVRGRGRARAVRPRRAAARPGARGRIPGGTTRCVWPASRSRRGGWRWIRIGMRAATI